jgi:hypothetical protein
MDRWDPPDEDRHGGRKRDRLARFYKVVRYLDAHPEGSPPAEVARFLGVSRRTVYRDLAALEQELEIPVWADRGRWGLVEGALLPAFRLTLGEAMAVFLAARHALDLAVLEAALAVPDRAAAEDLGLAYVEGARARRCRIAVDGTVFRAAFPQVRWLVGTTDLSSWRGELETWVFGDGQLGRVEARLGGPGYDLEEGAIRADVSVVLDATYRGDPINLVPPAG